MTLIFSSITYALKAQRILSDARIYSTLTRSPAVTAVRGCGYGLRLAEGGKAAEATELLRSRGINILGTVKE